MAGMISTSTQATVDLANSPPKSVDALVVLVHKDQQADAPELKILPQSVRDAVVRLTESGSFRAASNQTVVHLLDKGAPAPRLVLIGLGNIASFSAECLREAAVATARAMREHRLKHVALVIPPVPDQMPGRPETQPTHPGRSTSVSALTLGFYLGAFAYTEYRGSAAKPEDIRKQDLALRCTLVTRVDAGAREALKEGRILGEGQNFARTIASRPGNDINPPRLAEVARELAKQVGLTCRVLDEKQMKRLGMGGILAVGSGSAATPPRMIVLEHNLSAQTRTAGKKRSRRSSAQPLLVVGKAITFDTGGISIKPADKMGRMIYDKCGGMAVLGLMYVLAKLKDPRPVVGILASAENHISDTAYRPGDILRMYNGVTVDVTNTDAEGRLVLSDALAWGIETYQPKAVVDLATLTGGVIIALGKNITGVMSNDDALYEQIATASELAGEQIWRLPLGDEQRKQMRGESADLVNSAGREASPLQGGAFLSYFIPGGDKKVPWLHFDIAGTAETDKVTALYGKGPTGWGVRTLVEWVRSAK